MQQGTGTNWQTWSKEMNKTGGGIWGSYQHQHRAENIRQNCRVLWMTKTPQSLFALNRLLRTEVFANVFLHGVPKPYGQVEHGFSWFQNKCGMAFILPRLNRHWMLGSDLAHLKTNNSQKSTFYSNQHFFTYLSFNHWRLTGSCF